MKRDVELARLKLVIEQSYVTDEVRTNGFGGVDMKRLESSIDQLGQAFKFTNKPRRPTSSPPSFFRRAASA